VSLAAVLAYHAPPSRKRPKETTVPIIRIEMFPGRTLAQKRELVRLITDAVCNVAHTDPKNTHIIFEEHSVEEWAWDGKLYVDQDDEEE
jgi:4-oxalocrotonate tautomerase